MASRTTVRAAAIERRLSQQLQDLKAERRRLQEQVQSTRSLVLRQVLALRISDLQARTEAAEAALALAAVAVS